MLGMALVWISLLLTACAAQPEGETVSVEPRASRPEAITPSRSPSGPPDYRPKPRKKINPDTREYGQAKAPRESAAMGFDLAGHVPPGHNPYYS